MKAEQSASAHAGPLAGLRVLDLSIMAAGPWVGALLGELGAEVIKVEPPAGDGTRWVKPTQQGMGTNYICMNVNKLDVTLDLKNPADRKDALELVKSCDVLVQNFRIGVAERLGVGHAVLREMNPRLVYCSVSGFGEDGPLMRERCADFIMQAFSGFAQLNGALAGDSEAFRFTGFLDLATASVATEAILFALLEREQTGLGQHVDVSMLEAAFEMQFTRMASFLATECALEPAGSESEILVPDRAFASADHEVFVSVRDEREWRGFCDALERPDLAADARFATNAQRCLRRAALYDLVAPVFAARPAIWWLRALERCGVPCGLGANFENFRHHRQVVQNEMIAELETPWGAISVGGVPWHFSDTVCTVRSAPVPGADTHKISARSEKPV